MLDATSQNKKLGLIDFTQTLTQNKNNWRQHFSR